jgi:hypothetical protein
MENVAIISGYIVDDHTAALDITPARAVPRPFIISP